MSKKESRSSGVASSCGSTSSEGSSSGSVLERLLEVLPPICWYAHWPADVLPISAVHVRNEVSRGRGPDGIVKIGGRAGVTREGLISWLASRMTVIITSPPEK